MLKCFFSVCLVLLVSLLLGACDSSDTEKDSGVPDASDRPPDERPDAAANDAEIPETGDEEEAFCGDSIVQKELNEICDDGNLNDNDGCTSLCEYSCIDNSDCDDLNICNGTERCNDDHYCDFGKFLDDGVECENQKSCYSGLCVPNVCGDKRRQGDEECDDGDTLNDNGCTTDCEYTCESDDECTEGDICAGSRTCDLDDHTCTGSPKENKSSCNMPGSGDPGWCIKGVCVPDRCGDGELDDNEQCDEGLKNGDPGSTCTLFCETTICGNGKIEPGEQCDDDNTSGLDGCSSNCRAEVWVRWTTMNLLKDASPEWCVHEGKNQLSNAFPGSVRDSGTGFEMDVLGMINGILNGAFDDCGSNVLTVFEESSDVSFRTSDDEVYLSVFEGELEEDETCESPMDVDTRFFVAQPESGSLNETILKTKTAQRPGVIKTLEPEDILSRIPGMGAIKLHDLTLLIEVDIDSLSAPKSPPEMAQSVEMPKRMGFNDDDPPNPSGRLCGAVSADSMTNQGVDRESRLAYCCQSDGSPYTECLEDDTPGEDCHTFLDVMNNGCMICDAVAALSGGEPSCDTCDTFGLDIIYATPPDIDTNEDGVADAYSILIGLEGIRVRSTGVREAPEQ